jgi:hypothetical protein
MWWMVPRGYRGACGVSTGSRDNPVGFADRLLVSRGAEHGAEGRFLASYLRHPGAASSPHSVSFGWAPAPEQVGIYPNVTFVATDGLDETVKTITVSTSTAVRRGTWERYR